MLVRENLSKLLCCDSVFKFHIQFHAEVETDIESKIKLAPNRIKWVARNL